MQAAMIEKIAEDCDRTVRNCWRYVRDGAIDEWMDYSDFFSLNFPDAMVKNPWAVKTASLSSSMVIRGDCDDQAMTTLCLMHKRGVPLDHLHVGVVYADEQQNGMPAEHELFINHAVGLVEYAPGQWRVVGDTFIQTYRLDKPSLRFPHRIVFFGSFLKPTSLTKWVSK